MDKKSRKVPQVGTWLRMLGVILVLLCTAPLLYLGCGSTSEPPPGNTGAKPELPDAGRLMPPPEPREEDITRGGPAKTAALSQFQVIDRILDKLPVGNIAFNAPASIYLDKTASIELILSLSKPIEELKQMIEAEGEKQGESIKVSNQMEARLTGPYFQIHAVTPESQAIPSNEVTKWQWEVKPVKAGQQKLHLTLISKFTVQGQPTSRTIRTFDKTIEVNVTLSQKVTVFWEKFGQWLWAGIIIPVAGWLWKRRKASQGGAAPGAAPKEDDSP